MKCRHITLIFFILFSPHTHAKSLDTQDKQAVQKLVKTLTTKLFLLETTEYNSSSLQKELLAIMPDKIAAEGEYEPLSKQKYIDHSIELAIDRKRREVQKIIPKDVTPMCRYIEDDTVDCDFLEKIKMIEKADVIPQQPLSYSTGTEYKFNLKMDEAGEWYINKMKTWNVVPAPPISTLMIEKEHREKLKKEKRIKLNSPAKNEDYLIPPASRPSVDIKKLPRSKKTDLEIAEEEAEKEEQELLLQQYEDERKMFEKSNAPKILVDRNGNIIGRDTIKSPSYSINSLIKKKFEKIINGEFSTSKSGCHPMYGCSWGWDRGKLWNPMYARAYAFKYALNYNSDYRRFFNDCANFVSQCLVNGGWQNDWGYYSSNNAWYYGWYGQSYTWGGARNLHQYIRYQVEQGNAVHTTRWWTDSYSPMRPGDVVALTLHRHQRYADHMMIVTSIHNGQVCLSGHTRDRLNKPLKEIDPKGYYWGWGYHIKHGNLK